MEKENMKKLGSSLVAVSVLCLGVAFAEEKPAAKPADKAAPAAAAKAPEAAKAGVGGGVDDVKPAGDGSVKPADKGAPAKKVQAKKKEGAKPAETAPAAK